MSEAAENFHRQVRITYRDWMAWVDEGIAEDVLKLWRVGIPTVLSCEGGSGWERMIGLPLREVTGEQIYHAVTMLPWASDLSLSRIYSSEDQPEPDLAVVWVFDRAASDG